MKNCYLQLTTEYNNIRKVNSQKHLGVILDIKLTFEEHLKNVFKKTKKTKKSTGLSIF